MNKKDFENISLNGRVAFAISCFENTLLYLDYNESDWSVVLNYLWKFTSIQYLDDWEDMVSEIIPYHLLEFRIYEEHDFEYLDRTQFKHLYELYQTIDEKINVVIAAVYNIGTSHAYTIIVENGQRSLDELETLINYMVANNIPLPDIKLFEQFSITENKGWGNKFDGTELSKILFCNKR